MLQEIEYYAAGESAVGKLVANAEPEPEVQITLVDSSRYVGSGSDFFQALLECRRQLDELNIQLNCNGARRDVFPSAMQSQTGLARRAYLVTFPRSKYRPPVVDIFGPSNDLAALATVEEQLAWHKRWLETSE